MRIPSLFLTESQIDSIQPSGAAFDVILDHIHMQDLDKTASDEYVRQLPQHWRAVYTVCVLDGEVNNGGHHQFFWNSEGALNAETLEDLRLIAAHPFVLLFEEALDVFNQHDYVADKLDSGDSKEAFLEAYREGRMELLDTAWYAAKKTPYEYVDDYIREHRLKYLAKAEPDGAGNSHRTGQ